jgi:SecD/SecF fusion protein
MQNKGSITFVAIILVIISIFYLSFTWVTRSIENDAREFAAGDTKLEENYLDSLSSEIVYNLGIIDYTYRECKEHEINLGLDLKGGMNVTLEISVIDVIRALANHSTDTSFTNAIKLAKTKQQGSQEDFVTLFGQAFSELNPDGRLAAIFSTLELKDRISYESTNEEVLEIISEETEGAISNSYNILRSRIDRFGVVQPNIQKLETSGRVLVELPGIKEPERVRKLLQGTASLEFWETFENAEVFNYLSDANKRIREMQIGSDEDGSEIDSTLQNEDNEVISDVEPTKELPEEN